MKPIILLAALAAAASLGGCATDGIGAAVLKDIQGCDRHYEGALGAGVNASFKIDCKAQEPPRS